MTDIHDTLAILAENDGTPGRDDFPHRFDPRRIPLAFRRLADQTTTAVLELLDPATQAEGQVVVVTPDARLGAIAGYDDHGNPDDDYVVIAPATKPGHFHIRWRTSRPHGQVGAEVERHGVTITEAETLLFACLPRIAQYDFDIVPMSPTSWADQQEASDRMAPGKGWLRRQRASITVRLHVAVGEA